MKLIFLNNFNIFKIYIMEEKIYSSKYTKLIYKVNHTNEIPNPEKELYRKQIMNNINNKYNIKIGDVFLYGYINNLNTHDPVLCSKIYKADIKDDKKRESIIKDINKYIKEIKKIKNKNF